jgi:hypothetical protein
LFRWCLSNRAIEARGNFIQKRIAAAGYIVAQLTTLHIASLAWGIAIELGPWPCPLTAAQQWFQTRPGQTPYHESSLAHYLDKLIYPDLPEAVVAWSGAAACTLILAIYSVRLLRHHRGI